VDKGGLGKTSLVKSIYQNEDLRTKFQKRAYVTIKHPFILTDILDSLVKQLDKEEEFARKEKDKERGGDRTKLGVKRQWLADLLNKDKYLIVLDDLTSTKEWNTIKNYLPKTNTEGRIIVTTSTENIARHCSNNKDKNIYKLKSLDQEDALELFKKTVLIIFSSSICCMS
jgi:disease resistance protein RPM1